MLKVFGFFRTRQKVIFVCFGSEIRPAHKDRSLLNMLDERVWEWEKKQRSLVRMIEKCCDVVVSHPPISDFLEGCYIQYTRIGIPTVVKEERKLSPPLWCSEFRILHIPSDPIAKGTEEIRQIVSDFTSDARVLYGIRVVYTECINEHHDVVLEKMKYSHVVFDQIHSDMACSFSVLEACSLGIPYLIGGEWESSYDAINPHNIFRYVDVGKSRPPSRVIFNKILLDMISNYGSYLPRTERRFLMNLWSPERVAIRYINMLK